jgi:hypothetical protein
MDNVETERSASISTPTPASVPAKRKKELRRHVVADNPPKVQPQPSALSRLMGNR